MDDDRIYGDPATVIKQITRSLERGHITTSQAAELLAAMLKKDEGKDVTIGFRVALIMQGYEAEALRLAQVRMHLVEAGAMFNYSVIGTDEWLLDRDTELDPVFLKASIAVLRAGNIDAELDPSEPNLMKVKGQIVANLGDSETIEQQIAKLREELDTEFPDKPKPRQGEWW